MKKIIDFIFSIHPFFYLLFVTIFFGFLTSHFNDKYQILEYLMILFGICVAITIPSAIDSFLSNYSRLAGFFIVLFALVILVWVLLSLPSNILSNSFIDTSSIFVILSFLLYLFISPIKGLFHLIKKIKWKFVQRFVAYIERLLNPIYFFPIKVITYSIYYLIKFSILAIVELVKAIFDAIKYPFKSFRNFLKSLFIIGLTIYIAASMFVIVDYIRTHYGYYTKFFCSVGTSEKLKKSVVRIVGGYAEGTGFFISENQVLTNFHVIDSEPSPKIIFPDGTFITPTKITGDKEADLAILFTENNYPQMVMSLPQNLDFKDEEPLLAVGYPMGTEIVGQATVLKGNYVDIRKSKKEKVPYIQTNISLVEGMSGGPLVDQCGNVVGINTMGMAGLSLFISGQEARNLIPSFTDQEIEKINVDPSKSPQDAVNAFYVYLKARRMKDGFNLLSRQYLQKTNFEEWTARFKDILDVDVVKTEIFEKTKDTVFIKFGTKNWVDGEVEFHYYEGTWQTILEDGVYKMLKSNIKEVEKPTVDWFYE